MRFGIDLDGVLGNFGARVIEVANSIWPGKLSPDFVPDNWNYVGVLTDEEWDQIWARIKAIPHFWLDEQPMVGVEELRALLRPTDEVFFITARMPTVGAPPLVQSAQWLQGQGLWPREGYSVVLPVLDAKHKKDLFQGLKLSFMLDDYVPTVEQLNHIPGMRAYVLDQPWNRYAKELPRVYSVAEYLHKVRAAS